MAVIDLVVDLLKQAREQVRDEIRIVAMEATEAIVSGASVEDAFGDRSEELRWHQAFSIKLSLLVEEWEQGWKGRTTYIEKLVGTKELPLRLLDEEGELIPDPENYHGINDKVYIKSTIPEFDPTLEEAIEDKVVPFETFANMAMSENHFMTKVHGNDEAITEDSIKAYILQYLDHNISNHQGQSTEEIRNSVLKFYAFKPDSKWLVVNANKQQIYRAFVYAYLKKLQARKYVDKIGENRWHLTQRGKVDLKRTLTELGV